MPITPTARWRSVRHAARGVAVVLRTQHNAWLHAIATGVVLAAGFFVGLSRLEWCAIVLAMVAVWTAEALNTAIEILLTSRRRTCIRSRAARKTWGGSARC